jgi:hypothetical protein
MSQRIYATHLGLIPSTEIAFRLRLDAEDRRRDAAERREREERAQARAIRRREFWARVRAGLTGGDRARVA